MKFRHKLQVILIFFLVLFAFASSNSEFAWMAWVSSPAFAICEANNKGFPLDLIRLNLHNVADH